MNKTLMAGDLRAKIIANPDVLLDDPEIMRALVGANDAQQGGNVVDLRGKAMERLEARFDRLEDTHRNVIAAAYDNLAGTNQVHRAILRMMDANTFEGFLEDLTGDVAAILRVDAIYLVMETTEAQVQKDGHVIFAPEGFIDDYITMGRNTTARNITLRKFQHEGASIYGRLASHIRSEACLKLDLGKGKMPAMLLMGCADPAQFTPQQGTDLLGFFSGVLERVMRRWLA